LNQTRLLTFLIHRAAAAKYTLNNLSNINQAAQQIHAEQAIVFEVKIAAIRISDKFLISIRLAHFRPRTNYSEY